MGWAGAACGALCAQQERLRMRMLMPVMGRAREQSEYADRLQHAEVPHLPRSCGGTSMFPAGLAVPPGLAAACSLLLFGWLEAFGSECPVTEVNGRLAAAGLLQGNPHQQQFECSSFRQGCLPSQ